MLLLTPATVCVAGLVVIVAYLSLRLTHPHGYEHPGPSRGLKPTDDSTGQDPREAFGYSFQEVSFPTQGGATLRGWLVPGASSARLGVVTAHGRAGDRRDLLRHLPVFHELGLPTLLFDYREAGASDGSERGMSMGARESQDISAAVRYMKGTLGLRRVAVVGVSLGGTGAILAAANDSEIDAVVAESPVAGYEQFVGEQIEQIGSGRPLFRPMSRLRWLGPIVVYVSAWRMGFPRIEAAYDVVDRIAPRPLLLMHGTGDVAVRLAHSEALYARAGEPIDLWVAEGSSHTHVYDDHPDEYRARVQALLAAILREPLISAVE